MNEKNKGFLTSAIDLIKNAGCSNKEILACVHAHLDKKKDGEEDKKQHPASSKVSDGSPYRGDEGYRITLPRNVEENHVRYQGGMP